LATASNLVIGSILTRSLVGGRPGTCHLGVRTNVVRETRPGKWEDEGKQKAVSGRLAALLSPTAGVPIRIDKAGDQSVRESGRVTGWRKCY
jgi:hypothetical protein